MPYQVSMMGWVGSGEDFCGLGWVSKKWPMTNSGQSVRLSRWCIVFTWLEISSNIFLGPVAHYSSFWPQSRYPFPRGTHSAGAQNTRGGKFCDFRLKSPFI